MIKDHRDAIPINGESSDSSNEGDTGNDKLSMNVSNAKSGEKRKLPLKKQKGKRNKLSTRKLSVSIDRGNSAFEEVATKINTIMAPTENEEVACVEELLATG